MRAPPWGPAVLSLSLAGACADFHGSDPAPEGGGAADGGAPSSDASPSKSGIVLRGVVQTESPSGVQVQLPFGTQKGDFVWATVFAGPIPDATHCTPSPGWTLKRKASTLACATVYSGALHLYRFATDAEPAVQSPCVLDAQFSSASSGVALAVFAGVDPSLPFEDFQAYAIPPGAPTAEALVAPEATAASASAQSFVVFVDPDGHDDRGWATPDGTTKGTSTVHLALFLAPVGQAGAVPARTTRKAGGASFCPTAEASTVVLHPKL